MSPVSVLQQCYGVRGNSSSCLMSILGLVAFRGMKGFIATPQCWNIFRLTIEDETQPKDVDRAGTEGYFCLAHHRTKGRLEQTSGMMWD